ncbi:hypothetical protein ATE67_13835 [Sphingopyxis sp. H050]|jgi:hypothetical protein|uniref:hypothetical protein n=1 Tax=Sphingopyxis sp. H050 TaxID=1759072 RepID=UPI0007368817|nr:hypothetical protein [Sphingopyxis sp. H050]KTE19721.1 hypothetical protein ATE67_13835 [Sphingopyxis sp. H050]
MTMPPPRDTYQNAPGYFEREVGPRADPEYATASEPFLFEDTLYFPALEMNLARRQLHSGTQMISHIGCFMLKMRGTGVALEMTPTMLRELGAELLNMAAVIENEAQLMADTIIANAKAAGK